MNINFQLGLLHFVHLLVNIDGKVDDREIDAILAIKEEEQISDSVYDNFKRSVVDLKEQDIYYIGVDLLNRCTEEERLCAFVHLYRLAQADESIHIKEVRLLLYAIKLTQVDFDDIVLSVQIAGLKSLGWTTQV